MTGTTPRAGDRAAMTVMAASAPGRVLQAAIEGVFAASRTSQVQAAIAGVLPDGSPAGRARALSLIALVASIVALVLPLAGTRSEPLLWVVPAVVMLVALVALWLTSRGETGRA